MKSKKIKKIIIYTLVAMIVSTSVFFSYEKASRVKAAFVVDDAIIIATLLGAMGIVYIGSEWYGSNLAEDWYPDYGEELGEIEDNIINLWDTEVWQLHDQGVITNPPDNFDPDNDDPEENPPTWEKLKAWMKAHPTQSLAIGTTTLLGGLFATVASKLDTSIEEAEIVPVGLSVSSWLKEHIAKHEGGYKIISSTGGTLYRFSSIPQIDVVNDKYAIKGYYAMCRSSDQYCRNAMTSSQYNSIGTTPYINWTPDGTKTAFYLYQGELQNPKFISDNFAYSSNPRGDEYGNIILPNQEIAPVGQVQLAPLLDALYNANQATDAEQAEQLKQQAVDNYIETLGNPEVNPEPNPNPNPDEGEDSGSTDTENNSSFLADLSHLFPFCIPFDLINCVKLLTAERETPCVEVPMHFKFVDVDYTWVIDLEDFNGVASVCRTMFLLLYIVGLVMVTRPLIRG